MSDNYIINYTTINHTARLKLGITNTEYVFLDLVCNLSNDPRFNRWCFAKKTKLAAMAEISETHAHRLISKFTTGKYRLGNNILTCPLLLEKDPITKNIRTTPLWYETVVIKKELLHQYREDRKQKETSSQKAKDVPPNRIVGESNDFAASISQTNDNVKKDLNYFMGRWKEINQLNYEKFFKVKAQREAEQKLLDSLGEENLDLLHDKLHEINQTPYVGNSFYSYSPIELLRNYPRYENQRRVNKKINNSHIGKRMVITKGDTQ